MGRKKKMISKTARDIGVPVESPPSAECSDSRCPYHGELPIRGRIFRGEVVSDKAPATVVVEWEGLRKIPKYQRYMRRRSSASAFNPPCIGATEGDVVRIAECRPLSKTKHFVVIEKLSAARSAAGAGGAEA